MHLTTYALPSPYRNTQFQGFFKKPSPPPKEMVIAYEGEQQRATAWHKVEAASEQGKIDPKHIVSHCVNSDNGGTSGSIEVRYNTPTNYDELRVKGFDPKPSQT